MSKSIWLSGTRGFVGGYVKRSLLDSQNNVTCISNSETNGDDTVFVDFSNRNSIKDAIKKFGVPDTFIHLGWGNVYEPHHESHCTVNVQDGKNLVDELFAAGVERFILIGSSSEYGDRTGELREDYSPTGEINNYVKGKLALAKYGLEAAKKTDKVFLHVRLFYTFGAGQKHNSLINQLFDAYKQGELMRLSPCEHFRDYIHVSEAAEGMKRLLSADQSGIVNLGSGQVIKLKEFVQMLWDQLGADPALLKFGSHDVPSSEQSQPRSYADLNMLRKLTDWQPSLSIKEGIDKTIADFRLSD